MPFTLDALATELGIPLETIQAKPDVVSKWNGYLSEADTQYRSAKTMKEEAEAKLAAVEAEQKVINDNIAAFGVTEANTAALRANYAAMEASLKALKEQGFNVNIPDAPKVNEPVKNEFNPDAFRNDVNQSLILGFDMNNRYQRLYGQPMPDDLQTLLREAQQQRKPLQQYVAEKYDFTGKETSMKAEAQAKHDAAVAEKAVNEWKEKNPVMAGNPELMRGRNSQHPQVVRERPAMDKGFSNMSQREKIARSVATTAQYLKGKAS